MINQLKIGVGTSTGVLINIRLLKRTRLYRVLVEDRCIHFLYERSIVEKFRTGTVEKVSDGTY